MGEPVGDPRIEQWLQLEGLNRELISLRVLIDQQATFLADCEREGLPIKDGWSWNLQLRAKKAELEHILSRALAAIDGDCPPVVH